MRWPQRIVRWRRKISIKPIGTPLPNIACDGMETIAVRRKAIHQTGSGVTVFGGIFVRKFALPDIAQVRAAWNEFVTPRIKLLLQTAARCIFPLRLGG